MSSNVEPGSSGRPTRRSLGLRQEVLLFVPSAILLLLVITAFDLLTYRNAVEDVRAERLAEASTVARRAAARLASERVATGVPLARLAPGAVGISVHGAGGRILARSGNPATIDLEALASRSRPDRALTFGPDETGTASLVALAPFELDGQPRWVQIDFAAPRLAAHVASLQRVLILNVALLAPLVLLMLFFLRRLLAPYDRLLERARRLDGSDADTGDETEFLVKIFERALEALDERRRGGNDIAVIERTLAPSLESGFLLLDPEGIVLALNDTGASLLRVEQPPPGTPLEAVLPGEEELVGRVIEAVASGRLEQRQECRIGPPEEQRILGWSVHPLRRDDGEIRGFIVLFADLTRVQARARQDQISRNLSQLGEIAAGVAHEMRNGLGTLKGYLSLIDHSRDEESVRDYLAEMRAESAHLERVLADFLSFARPGSLRRQRMDAVDLVSRATADPALAEAEFDLVTSPGPLELSGDRQLLDRALRNLLQNAVEAQRDAGSTEPIGVRVGRSGETLEVEITDRGGGLPEDQQEALFQPFVSGRPDGVGLGLALAHRIAALHEGTLELENRPRGGARARLRLPVDSADEPD